MFMLPRAVRLAAVSLLALSLGLHWAMLQTVAWTGMLVSYSRDASFADAVGKTFDGKHPCRLCKVIQKGQEEESHQDKQNSTRLAKLELGLASEPFELSVPPVMPAAPNPDVSLETRSQEPARPRPRLA